MMKTVKFSLFFLLLTISNLLAVPVDLGPFTFDGGYVLSKSETDLAPNESRDMCNCIVDSDGGLTKVKGSKRFVEQAISTEAVNSLYRYGASSGSAVNKTLLAVVGNRIVHSTGGASNVWATLTNAIVKGDRWNWVTMNNEAIGVSPNNRIRRFNLNSNTFNNFITVDVSTHAIDIKAKYAISAKNYFIVGNVVISSYAAPLQSETTSYPSRIYYSLLLPNHSSMTASRFIEYRTDNGEEITGLGNLFDRTHIFKASSIGELNFTVLNLPSLGGDWVLSEVVTDFGLEAPYTLAQRGGYYILGAKDGIRLWDGGRRARATSGEELTVISRDIQPLIEKLIRTGNYKNAVGKYYPKRDWYLFSYSDPDKFPKDRNNSVLAYDFKLGKWFPLCNWLPESFETLSVAGDDGTLIYGDSVDGHIYYADLNTRIDDAKKQLSVDTMDSTASWRGTRINNDFVNIREGTGSVRMWIDSAQTESSMTIVKVFQFGEWYDKTRVSKDDKLTFKVFITSVGNITNFRTDLLVNDVDNAFDSNFTSVTFTSAALVMSNSQWKTIEIKLSSFPIRPDWTDLNTENAPFANTFTYYGLRFVVSGVDVSSISIDDCRLEQTKENKKQAYWTSKMFNFDTLENKNFGQIVTTFEKPPESTIKIDFFNNFGEKFRSEMFSADVPKEFYVTGIPSTQSLTALDSSDFSVIRSTEFNTSEFQAMNGTFNKDFMILMDRNRHRIMKLNRNAFGVLISTYGSLGSGTTNQNIPHQVDIKGDSFYFTDLGNNRIKEHSLRDLSFIRMYGTLGLGTTSLHQPTAISANDTELTCSDEGNYNFKKFSISTIGYISSTQIDYNKIGDTSFEEDDKYRYAAYEKVSESVLTNIDIILEKRFKTTNEIVNRVVIKRINSVVGSTYNIRGDIILNGQYIFIAFTDDFYNPSKKYFIQKRLRDDLSIVSEYETTQRILSLIGYSQFYKPAKQVLRKKIGSSGVYFQVRYYDDENDNYFKLFNHFVLLDPTSISY